MSSNRIFLVCSHHPNFEDSFCIGERTGNDAKHMGCGRGLDHFQIGYHRPLDYDLPKLAIAKADLQ